MTHDYSDKPRPAKVPQTDGTWSGELDDLLQLPGGLSDWELKFICSVDDARRQYQAVSVKQVAKIREIWDEKAPGNEEM